MTDRSLPAQSSTPVVGERYIATDNKGAIEAMCGEGYPVPNGVLYVTIKSLYPNAKKVQVYPDSLWLTYAQLAEFFRPTGAMAS